MPAHMAVDAQPSGRPFVRVGKQCDRRPMVKLGRSELSAPRARFTDTFGDDTGAIALGRRQCLMCKMPTRDAAAIQATWSILPRAVPCDNNDKLDRTTVTAKVWRIEHARFEPPKTFPRFRDYWAGLGCAE